MTALTNDQLSVFDSLLTAIKKPNAASNNNDIVRLLLDNPWAVSCRVNETALLHIAAEYNNLVAGKSLIALGCSPNIRTGEVYVIDEEDFHIEFSEGNTPLILASAKGHYEFCQLLIEHGADVNLQNSREDFALRLSVAHGHELVIELLLKANADPNLVCSTWSYKDCTKYTYGTALHSTGNPDVIHSLIKFGANVNLNDDLGRTPLHQAAIFNSTKAIVAFIQAGASLDAKDNYVVYNYNHRETPLCLSITCGHVEATSVLLAMGANLDDMGDEEKTWRDYLHENGEHSEALFQILSKHETVN